MPQHLTRRSSARPHSLLTRLIEEPEIVSAIQQLEPTTLSAVIRHIGLEDAGEIVAMATVDQLEQVFDIDLWTSERPGVDESFDADRFVVWLEVMLEAGAEVVAQKLTELPDDLVMLAVTKHILVINLDEMALDMSGGGVDVDLTEKALDSCLYQEFDEHRVISKSYDGWDGIVAILAELNESHFDYLLRLLERCCNITTDFIADNGGLYNVLTSAEMLESDVAAEREDRRARIGFISPSAAAGFLKLAQVTELEALVASNDRDPVARMYFRNLKRASAGRSTVQSQSTQASAGATARDRLVEALVDAGILEPSSSLLLVGGNEATEEPTSSSRFRRAMAALLEADPSLYEQRMLELTFLGNVLMASGDIDGRKIRPLEAIETVVAVCNVGLEHLGEGALGEDGSATTVLVRESADKLFRIGWHIRHQDP